jgi:hypothetical protein
MPVSDVLEIVNKNMEHSDRGNWENGTDAVKHKLCLRHHGIMRSGK